MPRLIQQDFSEERRGERGWEWEDEGCDGGIVGRKKERREWEGGVGGVMVRERRRRRRRKPQIWTSKPGAPNDDREIVSFRSCVRAVWLPGGIPSFVFRWIFGFRWFPWCR